MAAPHTSYEPLPRADHAAVAVDNKLHMWGGWPGSRKELLKLAHNLEVFDISMEQWEQKPTHGTPPPGLWDTAYAVVGSCLFVFGGFGDESRHNSLYKLNLRTFQWEQVRVSNPSSGPQRKSGCGMVSYGDNQLVVFAGYTGRVWTDELHVFDLNKGEWSSPAVTGTKPPPLAGFSFTKVDSRRAVVYGGGTGGGTSGDAYVLELDKWHWTKLNTTGGPRPPARDSHAACCIAGPLPGQEHPLLLVGGGFSGSALKDMWLLDVDRGVWSEVTLPQEMGPRYGHTATVFGSGPNFGMVVMFGGMTSLWQGRIAETTLLHLEWQVTRVVTEGELGRPMGRLREQMEKLQLHSSHRSEGKADMSEQQLAMAGERVRRLEGEKQAAETRAKIPERRNSDLQRRAEEAERRARDAENTTTDLIRQTTDANQRMREAEARAQESTQAVTQAEQRATQAEQRAILAEQRAKQAEQRATQAKQRVTQAEQRATQAEQRAAQAEQRATQAEQRAAQAEQRATQSDQRATQSEAGAHFFQQQIEELLLRVRQAEQTAREAQERARMTEQRAQRLETRGHDQFWVVNREEIQLTDQELGRGGWAVVRVAKFRGLRVAAKCLHNLIVSDYNRQLFVREMNIAARVRHPNLVQYIGAMMDGEPIILTELMATSLRAVLERRPFNPAQITSISLDVARALNYLHLMHPDPIIHRDISSANVLLEPGPNNSWRAKVSDYGSANFLQQLRTAGPGNPTYAAPEADIPSQQSPKMDVYSYGVLLLEMCSRRFPNPEECEALLQRVQQPAMMALIRQCMERELMRRPTMSDIIRQLE